MEIKSLAPRGASGLKYAEIIARNPKYPSGSARS